MSNFSELVDNLDVKVRSLVQKNKIQSLEVKDLRDKLVQAEQLNESLHAKVEQLEEKNKILRIAGRSSTEDKRDMKLKINEIVREVDKCIAQLNQ